MMPATPIRVVIADDESLVRSTISHQLQEQPDIAVVDETADADDAVHSCIEHKPHVVVMDIDMPGRSPFEAVREMFRHQPKLQVLFLTGFASDSVIEQALAVDRVSIATKSDAPEHIVGAIRNTIAGGRYFSPEIVRRLEVTTNSVRVRSSGTDPLADLTKREREVLGYVAAGMTKREMADTVHLSVKTIENHTQSLMTKLGIHNRVELALFAIRHGVSRP